MTAVDEGGVKYLLSDWQGSNRAVVSNSGYVLARNDYTAYGEEIASSIGLRTTAQGFAGNLIPRQKYGLTERDEATGLDHTWWRKHENRAGRWTSPDLYKGSMSLTDPQSFNRYLYVGNQPTNFVDPSGLFMMPPPPRERTQMEMCFLFGIGCYRNLIEPIDLGGGGGGGGLPPPVNNPHLEFNGCTLNYINSQGQVERSWSAVSGKQDDRALTIQNGIYSVNPANTQAAIWFWTPSLVISGAYVPSVPVMRPWANTTLEYEAWGDFRSPIQGGGIDGRGFYIHGGKTPGSAGCIDLTSGNNDFHKWFKAQDKSLSLQVNNTCDPWKT